MRCARQRARGGARCCDCLGCGCVCVCGLSLWPVSVAVAVHMLTTVCGYFRTTRHPSGSRSRCRTR
jgi:hypothetical protein